MDRTLPTPLQRELQMIEFFVPGIPKPGGSKRAVIHKHSGRAVVMESDPEKNRAWRSLVADRAVSAMRGRTLLTGPLWMSIVFFQMRPKTHFVGSQYDKGLKKSAPRSPVVRPDYLKLTRSTEDALTGIVWRDDSQVVEAHIYKRYGERPGADIRIQLWPSK